MSALVELDPEYVKAQLSSPPFVSVEGVSNVRTLGNYQSTVYPGQFTKPNFAYRSGEISSITAKGKDELEALGKQLNYDIQNYLPLALGRC